MNEIIFCDWNVRKEKRRRPSVLVGELIATEKFNVISVRANTLQSISSAEKCHTLNRVCHLLVSLVCVYECVQESCLKHSFSAHWRCVCVWVGLWMCWTNGIAAHRDCLMFCVQLHSHNTHIPANISTNTHLTGRLMDH